MKYFLRNGTEGGNASIVHARELSGVTRRDVLKGAGLTLAVIGSGGLLDACSGKPAASSTATLAPNQFLKIGPDSSVTLISPNTELGQGAYTGLATLLAEELDADWSQVVIEAAPVNTKLYGNPAFGGAMQGTGGSTTVAAFWDPLRKAGATARALLVAAAAQQWSVPAGEITISKGVVSHAGKKKSAHFGELVDTAAKLPVPADAKPKDPKDFVLIGKDTPRVDAHAKSSGKAIFTQDIQLPDMLVALVAYAPRFGGKVKSFDAAAAKAMPNVVNVVQFKTNVREGVAVLAKDTWSAKKARDALKIDWDESAAFKLGSDAIFAQYKALAEKPGVQAHKDGDFDKAAAGAKQIEAVYEFPFLAHASMEPMNCVIQVKPDGAELWNGEQFHTGDQNVVAQTLGLKPEQVKINMLFAGGSFGRRGNAWSDYLADVAAIAKADGGGKPVKLVWTREDDMRAGFYRPAYLHKLTAAIDGKGKLTGWRQRIVGQSIMGGTFLDHGDPVDSSSVEGAANMPYEMPNLLVELHTTKLGVPIQWWRSVGSTHTAYAVESFLDEIARVTHQDPLELRRSLLQKHPRHLAVLNLAAEKAGWGTPLPKGTARGIAMHESFNTAVAQVAEVSRQGSGYKVNRVVCAVDCGIAVNPNIVAMQMESGIIYGLSAIASGEIRVEEGRVKQGNFDGYPVLRINQVPKIEVYIVPSTNKPTGVGEPGTPVIGPAVASAIAQLSGKTLRELPFSKNGIAIV
ncbi:MAG TPA: xanthine dehydrogenase family protein molybdopterin-binding subunit [Steroidobacteraceae bacterium]|nr:xanthine dehydrogenase family protein molybdopterin-binding subunit [Steroidobacteraceae bacterium]